MTWVEAIPAMAVLAGMLYLPGASVLLLLRVRLLLTLAAAPAVSVAFFVVASVVAGAAGVRWTAATALAVVLVLVVAVSLLGRRLPGGVPFQRPGRAWAVTAGVAVAALVVLWDFGQVVPTPSAVSQMHDSLFHLNGAELVTQTGNASPLGAMRPLYDGTGGGFYPTAWHALVVLGAPVSDVVVAGNALLVVGVLVPWLVGVAALAAVVVPARPLVAALAPVVAAGAYVFPWVTVLFKGMFPAGLSLALTPGVLALGAVVISDWRRAGGRGWLAFVLASVGVVAAHPSGVGALGFVLAPLVVQVCWREAARLRRDGHRGRALALGTAPLLAVTVVVVALAVVPRLRAMATWGEAGQPWAEALRYALLGSTPQAALGGLPVAILVLVGAVLAAVSRGTRWLAGAWVVMLTLFVIAAAPAGPLRVLTGLWYSSPDRIQALLVTVGAVLGAIGAAALASWAQAALRIGRGRAETVTAALAVVLLVVAWVGSSAFRTVERVQQAAGAYDPDAMVHPAWADAAELDFLRSLDEVLAADAVVLGDALNGAAFVQVLAERRAYLPIRAASTDQQYLLDHFHDIHSDPRVCEIVRENGIGYFYADASRPYGPQSLAERSPGLYDVDVSTGFELVASAGDVRLYRITACG